MQPHGTRSRYQVNHCRCPACRDANAVYAARRRTGDLQNFRVAVHERTRNISYELGVFCWCETTVLHLPADVIRAGRTESCGRQNCHPPEVAAS